jgi:hypothetical protein
MLALLREYQYPLDISVVVRGRRLTVQADKRLNMGSEAVIDELIRSKYVWIVRQPSQFDALWALADWPNAVLPVVIRDKIACASTRYPSYQFILQMRAARQDVKTPVVRLTTWPSHHRNL